MKKKLLSILLSAAMVSSILAGCSGSSASSAPAESAENQAETPAAGTEEAAETTDAGGSEAAEGEYEYKEAAISLLIDKDSTLDGLEAVCALAKEKLGITVDVEIRAGGADGDNIVKTRLASGDMADLCAYNSGCKFTTLNPSEYFLDLSDQAYLSRLDESFLSAVTADGKVYGVPAGFASSAGVILYNRDTYEKYGLEVPHTWADFLKNCDVLKENGEVAVIGSFADSWTTQVVYLGDHYNVQAENPDFAKEFEAGTAKYATDPAGLKSWQKCVDLVPYYNEDYTATTYQTACDMLVNGEGTHWIITSDGVLAYINSQYGDDVNKIGAFGVPGDDADNHGITTWPAGGLYVNKNSENIDDILRFLNFWMSDEAINAYLAVQPPAGPIIIKGMALPDDAFQAVKDEQAYIDAGKACTALEYQTAVKGASCEQITQEAGTGQISAEEAAKAYDDDCLKQAVQLGLDW